MYLKIFSILGYLLAVSGAVYLFYSDQLFAENPLVIGIQIFAGLLMIWSRITFGIRSFYATADTTKGELVTKGPYHFLRHPIYASIIYFVGASLIAYPFLEVLLAFLAVFLGLFIRMILEEMFLKNKYPQYEAYSKKTKRFLPYVI
jgi:protein-S-isoprenylcysteine O-methyltransferase Ste14